VALTFDQANPDIKLQLELQREFWRRHYPAVTLHLLDREATNVDPLYQEAANPRLEAKSYSLPAHVEINPSVQRLRRFGVEEARDLVVSFSTVLLDDLGLLDLSTSFLIGSRVQFDADQYELLTQHRLREAYWLGTHIPLVLACTATRLRRGK
jgi:hypothetical protein